MKIYLDIDGVILTKEGNQMPHLKNFINMLFSIPNSEIFWLTTHCKEDNTDKVFTHIGGVIDEDTINLLHKVKPTKWTTLKTEAIDLSDSFLWFDDNILEIEKKILDQKNVLNSWIKVENNLDEIIKQLSKYLSR